jgi:hypothetical protein
MNDRILLELAAKAAGYKVRGQMVNSNEYEIQDYPYINNDWRIWNPLTDDGDALRLAVKLGMVVQTDRIDGLTTVTAGYSLDDLVGVSEPYADDPYAATRRAIVRAAAEIGKDMK